MESGPDMLVGPTTDTESFLDRCNPSANKRAFPWYWVMIPPSSSSDKNQFLKPADDRPREDMEQFMEDGTKLVDELTRECKRIEVEAPIRGNKKTGTKSRKELREVEHAKFNASVASLAKKQHVVSGKWLLYPSSQMVDAQWSTVVNALAKPDGALAQTGACHRAKVSTFAEEDKGYVICIYCDDSWDRAGIENVFKCLVHELGIVSGAYKCDANTILGIDSKHPSQIRSSLYTKHDFMTSDEINKALEERNAPIKKVPKKLTIDEEEAGFETDEDEDEEDEPQQKKRKV